MQSPPQFPQFPMPVLLSPETLQTLMQPYMRLAQGNMQLLTRFSASPEMMMLWMANAQKFMEQATRGAADGRVEPDAGKLYEQVQGNVTKVAQSDAFAELLRGMMQNYAGFLQDLAQTGMTVAGQEQSRWMRQMQEASGSVLDFPKPAPQRAARPRAAS